ncbi:MAG: hypothetical protein OCC45_04695 [Desulfotalea sp.]
MIHTAYTLHPGFIEELSRRISILIESTASTTIVGSIFKNIPLIPSQQLISQIIDAVVWASFSTDEGNPVTISIMLSPAEESLDTFIFDEPINFDVKHLVKLGAALENPQADISVWPDKTKALVIWGFRTRSIEVLLPTLCVEAMSPGNVLITFAGKSLAALSGNEAFFTDHSSLMRTIIPKLSSPNDKQSDNILYLMRYMSLLNTAKEMLTHARGGTLLVVPEGSEWQRSVDTPVPYTGGAIFLGSDYDVTKKPSLLTSVKNFFGGSSQNKSIIERESIEHLSRQLNQQCKNIAKLTAVDGALVMSFDRFIYCFGAKINTGQCNTPLPNIHVHKLIEGDSGSTMNLRDLGGTRHQSAAYFANAQPGAVAIVVSQDGHVSFITSDPETKDLIVIQHAELAVLHEGLGAALWSYSLFTEMDLL